MPISSRWFRTLILAGVVGTLAPAYPLPVYCKDNPSYLQKCLKESEAEFRAFYFEDFAFSLEGHLRLYTSLADWEAKRDLVRQTAMADGIFPGLIATYRAQLVAYGELLALYENCREQAKADPADKSKKEALDGVKSARNLVFEGLKNTHLAAERRYATIRKTIH